MAVLVQIGLWLVRKCGVAVLLVLVGLIVGALYLYLRENFLGEAERAALVDRYRAEVADLEATVAELETKLQAVRENIEVQRHRVEVARKLLETYEEMNSFWDWLFGTEVDRKQLESKKGDAAKDRKEADNYLDTLVREASALTAGRESAVDELNRMRTHIAQLELESSPVVQYLQRAWRTYRWPLVIALLGYFFGPTLWNLAAFYGMAPLVSRAHAIRLSKADIPDIKVSPSRVSEAVTLEPGESIFIRERYLQASDEGLKRRTRFVLDWSIPFTCAATGLIELVEMSNEEKEGSGAVTVSTQEDTAIELSVVQIPEQSGVVLRPSFLAAVLLPSSAKLRIRRHWRLFHLQSWVTLQFRYFEFRGPCRLVVAGSRGIRAESLAGGMGVVPRGRRTNQDSTIGFTHDLAYRSVRAETFWSYYRGRNPLFDDIFQGRGTFLCQEVPVNAPGPSVRRFWEAFWSGLLKIFGL